MKAKSLKSPEAAVLSAREVAYDKKAIDPLVLDVSGLTLLTDFFLIASGETLPHVRAIASAIEAEMDSLGWAAKAVEGKQEGKWVLLDYGEFMIHVFRDRERKFYNLEQFWHRAKVMKS